MPDYNSDLAYLIGLRENTDLVRFKIGLRLARMTRGKHYGRAIIPQLAREIGLQRATLQEYRQVAVFMVWIGGIEQNAAPRLFHYHPTWAWSHLRRAARMDWEAGLEALYMIDDGIMDADSRLTDEQRRQLNSSLPLSPDAFNVLCDILTGHIIPPPALFDAEITGDELLYTISRQIPEWRGKRLWVKITEIRDG